MAAQVGGLRHSEAVGRERNDPNIVVLFLLGAQMVILFLIGAAFYLSTVEAREAALDARKGVVCLIEQMTEHRYAQRAAHQADANFHNYSYDVPTDIKPQNAEETEATRRRLIVNCEEFLPPVVRVP